MKKAILYGRVSTEEQTRGASLETQAAGCRRFAEEQGLAIVGEFRDEGISGAIISRPALNKIRQLASEGAVDVLVVYDPDRLARKLSAIGYLEVEFERLGVQVLYVNTPNDPLHKLVKGMVGEIERMLITERSSRNKEATARSGKILGSGLVAYGYEYRDRHFHILPDEAAIVRQIFRWYGHEHCTMHEVVKRLTRLGVPTKRGGKWGKSAVGRILRNESYTGTWSWRKTKRAVPKTPRTPGPRKREDTTVILRPKKEWITYDIPKIIDHEEFDLVQRRIEVNKERNPRNNTKNQYLLRSLVFCGKCGRRYVGNASHGALFYRCNGTSSGNLAGGHEKCPSRNVRADLLERIVMTKLVTYITTPELNWSSGNSDGKGEEEQDDDSELKSLKLTDTQLDRSRSKLLTLYKKDLISEEELSRELAETKSQREYIARRREEIEGRTAQRSKLLVNRKQVERQCREIRQWLRKIVIDIEAPLNTCHIDGLAELLDVELLWKPTNPDGVTLQPKDSQQQRGELPKLDLQKNDWQEYTPFSWFDIERRWLEASQSRVEVYDGYAILRGVLPDIMAKLYPDDPHLSPHVNPPSLRRY